MHNGLVSEHHFTKLFGRAENGFPLNLRPYRVFGSSLYSVDAAEWLFPQARATLHNAC
jgi:hypothetical protein